jgi:hypothetical protein
MQVVISGGPERWPCSAQAAAEWQDIMDVYVTNLQPALAQGGLDPHSPAGMPRVQASVRELLERAARQMAANSSTYLCSYKLLKKHALRWVDAAIGRHAPDAADKKVLRKSLLQSVLLGSDAWDAAACGSQHAQDAIAADLAAMQQHRPADAPADYLGISQHLAEQPLKFLAWTKAMLDGVHEANNMLPPDDHTSWVCEWSLLPLGTLTPVYVQYDTEVLHVSGMPSSSNSGSIRQQQWQQ